MTNRLVHLLRVVRARVMLGAFTLVVACLVASCSQLEPNERDVKVAHDIGYLDATLEDLQYGLDLYRIHCAGCHDLHQPYTREPKKWPEVLKAEAERPEVEITASELGAIEVYLETLSSRPDPFPE